MEEKKKVFIRGRKGREQEVIDILAGLGANAPKSELADSDGYLYFINHYNEIGVALINSEVGAIIMDNYKEIELQQQQQWKEGDILAFNGSDGVYCSGIYAVFDKYAEKNTFESHILINSEGMRFGISLPTADYHLANYLEEVDFNRLYSYMMPHIKVANTVLKRNG